MCGQEIKRAIPAGGQIMLFVGGLDQENARGRRQGIIDELLDRSLDPARRDPVAGRIESAGGKYVIVGCMTDGADFKVGKDNAVDALTRHPDLACMVGLYAYNPPLILQALESSNRLGQVKVVAFDEDPQTLQGVREGSIHSTIVQDPYMYGYRSIELLAAVARGDRSVLPQSKMVNIPARVVDATGVDAFELKLNELLSK
jgi:ribose transport system substrate-binding protein